MIILVHPDSIQSEYNGKECPSTKITIPVYHRMKRVTTKTTVSKATAATMAAIHRHGTTAMIPVHRDPLLFTPRNKILSGEKLFFTLM